MKSGRLHGTIASVDQPELLAERYRLGPLLGRGGMGAVHRAHDELLGRDVAVKLLDVEQAPQAAVERFRREAQFLAGLSHPNVVTIFDFGTDEARAWLVMELLAGPTLQELVNDRGALPVEVARSYGRQCASALAAAHAAGITHRDVKPANLMLGADGTCKLLDLGIARLDGAATTQPALTQAGTILGTVPYLAPEVITGAAPEPPADLYALGAVLFTLLTAKPPFDAEDMMAAMAQHVHAPVPRPSSVRVDVSPDLDDLVVALLAKDPVSRPSAADVIARLDGTPATATAPTAALAGAAVASTQVLAPIAGDGSARSRLQPRTGLIALGIAFALALLAVVIVIANSGGDTSGSGTPIAGSTRGNHRSSSHPARPSTHPAATRSTPRPTPRPTRRPIPRPTPRSTPTPRPTDLPSALSALRSAITTAQADNAVSAADAQDLLHRVDAMSTAGSGPGGGPGHRGDQGNDQGNGKPKQHGGPPAPDLSGPINDFAHHLDDLRAQGAITAPAYNSIQSALVAVRSFAPSGSGEGGD